MKTILRFVLEYPNGCSFALAAVLLVFAVFYIKKDAKRQRTDSRADTRSRINQVIIPSIIRLRCTDPLSDINYIEEAMALGEIGEHELKRPMDKLLTSAIHRTHNRIFILNRRLNRHQSSSPRNLYYVNMIMKDFNQSNKDLQALRKKLDSRLAAAH